MKYYFEVPVLSLARINIDTESREETIVSDDEEVSEEKKEKDVEKEDTSEDKPGEDVEKEDTSEENPGEDVEKEDIPEEKVSEDSESSEETDIISVENTENLTLSDETLTHIADTDTCIAFGVFFFIGLFLARMTWERFK